MAAGAAATVEAVEPKTTGVLIPVRNAENGRWDLVDSSTLAELPVYAIPDEEEGDYDPGELGPTWQNGRGQYMAYRWEHADPRWHGKARSLGWEPVDPKTFMDPRYQVREIAGLGKCITYMDAILFEMGKVHADARQVARDTRRKLEVTRRIYGINDTLAAAAGEFNGMAQAKASIDQIAEGLGHADAALQEVGSISRAQAYLLNQQQQARNLASGKPSVYR